MAEYRYDVVIVGASFGGVSAALAAAADPKVRVVLLESSSWIGGQATSQGVTRWDDTRADLADGTGSTKSYRDLRNAIRAWYLAHANLSAVGQRQEFFNPGFSKTGPPFPEPGHPFSADPQVARVVLQDSLSSLSSRLDVKFGVRVTAVDIERGVITGIQTTSSTGTDSYSASVFLDATDLGDLLPLCRLEWRIGAESKEQTGEPDAERIPHPEYVQPITVPIALELRPAGENHTIAKPDGYADIVRDQNFQVVDGDISTVFNSTGGDTLWNYRRYIDFSNFADDRYPCDRSTINVGSNDYQGATIPTGSSQHDDQIIEAARAVSLGYLYWLQTDCPHDDDPSQKGYPNLMPMAAAFGTPDGTAPMPYIRESRRLVAKTIVVQQDIELGTRPKNAVRGAKLFKDTCGIGWYGVDIHHAEKPGTRYINFPTLPFQIPLGSLLSQTLSNFVAACKNIGTTHLTSGAYRVHPVEWAIGEAAGTLAAYCATQNVAPTTVLDSAGRLTAFQQRLVARGIPIFWWSDIDFETNPRLFAAVQLLAAKGILVGDDTLEFHPNDGLTQTDRDAIDARANQPLPWPAASMTRGDAAIWTCEQLKLLT
jgi:hypothetical protein